MKIAIVDDLSEDSKLLAGMLEDYGRQQQIPMDITTFSGGRALLESAELPQFEIVFLDIIMDELDGLETAKQLRKKHSETLLILITTESAYAVEGYEVEAAAFLIKPADRRRLDVVMERLRKRLVRESPVILADATRSYPVLPGDILYAEIRDHMLEVHTADSKLILRMTIEELRNLLPEDGRFLECHRGILLNLDFINRMEDQVVSMKNGTVLPISRRRRPMLTEAYAARQFQKARGFKR